MSVCINLTIYLVYKYSCVVFHTVYVLISPAVNKKI